MRYAIIYRELELKKNYEESEKIIKFLGISIEPEKDIVLILANNDKKNEIMNEIVSSCGLKTPGAGICFSLPVDHVVGLKELENLIIQLGTVIFET